MLRRANGNKVYYEKLIIATGSSPSVLPILGIEKQNVFVVKKDVAYLEKTLVAVAKAKDIVILGGGFIGAEFADECKKNHDVNVTIVEAMPHCLQMAFDEEFCIEAEDVLTGRGINIIANDTVSAILGEGSVTSVRLGSGKELKADVVIVSIGGFPLIPL